MNVRHVRPDELDELLDLYRLLHPDDPPVDAQTAREVWSDIHRSDHLVYLCAEVDGLLVSTCTLSVIPNLTRGARPYGLIENVVTHPDHRRKGLATAVLRRALDIAWARGCYKVMLMTGSKKEGTLGFYEHAGFTRGVKTGFIAYPPK